MPLRLMPIRDIISVARVSANQRHVFGMSLRVNDIPDLIFCRVEYHSNRLVSRVKKAKPRNSTLPMETDLLNFIGQCRQLANRRGEARRSQYMTEICAALGLDPNDLPDFTTLYKSFDRLEMWIWRALLRVSAQQHPQSGRRCTRQHVLRPPLSLIILPPAVRK